MLPVLKMEKSFHIGDNFSNSTAELTAVLMALNYLNSFPNTFFQILICVDSKSVLYALKSLSMKIRGEMIHEISHLVHVLSLNGSAICWVPSHCGLLYNNWADRAAMAGAIVALVLL